MTFVQVQLDRSEATSLREAAEALARGAGRLDHISALDTAAGLAAGLPAAVRKSVDRMREQDHDALALLVSGADVGMIREKPTPASFGEYEAQQWSRVADSVLFLIGASLGTPYCFASQQRGRLVLDVLPLPNHEEDQLGCSSTVVLEWHNEDAFHPLRADYTMLLCVRNEQRVATRFVAARDLELGRDVLDVLRRSQFVVVPDVSHSLNYNLATSGVAPGSGPAFARIAEMHDDLPRVPVLDGPEGDPRICVDFAYMPKEAHSEPANSALSELRAAIERAGRSIVLTAGDIVVLDNRRCVHGRESFTARYDGTDRWLRRLNVCRRLASVTERQVARDSLRVA